MTRYLISRAISALLIVFAVTTVCFFALQATGDPVLMFLPPGSPPSLIESTRHALGYDRPVMVQYLSFLGQAATGHFQKSLVTGQPAMQLVLSRASASLELAFAAVIIGIVFGMVGGYLSVAARSSWVRGVVSTIISLLQATPAFFLGIVAVLFFAVHLRWLPTGGTGAGATEIVLPALTLGLSMLPSIARIFRGSLTDVRDEDFITSLRARGVPRARLTLRHLVPNASLPLITVLGMEFGSLLGGTVIVEQIFSWPGLGRLIVQSILTKDFPTVLAGIVFLSFVFASLSLIVDVLYGVIDPRVRLHRTAAA